MDDQWFASKDSDNYLKNVIIYSSFLNLKYLHLHVSINVIFMMYKCAENWHWEGKIATNRQREEDKVLYFNGWS